MSGRPVVVVGRPADVEPLACRMAAGAARVLLAAREAGEQESPLAFPGLRGGRALARRLGEAGISASPRGSMAVVQASEDEPLDALAFRVAQACGREPVVALLRPRSGDDGPLLSRAGVVVAEGVPGAAAEIILEELRGQGVEATVEPPPAGAAELLARGGLSAGPLGDRSGQASVEAVALLPLLLAAVLAAGQLLAAGAAGEVAGHAATAGAAALIQGRDGRQAARRALPGWARRRAHVAVSGRRVTVRLRPPGAGPFGDALEARRVADAGPAP